MSNELEDTIRGLEERLRQAQLASDVTVLGELLADDALFTGMNGELETKASDLHQHRSGMLKIEELVRQELRIRPIPNGAVARSKMSGAATIHGQRVIANLTYTRVWIQHDGRWQIVAAHMSAVQP